MAEVVSDARVRKLLQRLTGQEPPNATALPKSALDALDGGKGWGWSQFNEILLLLGYDRICQEFFQYLVTGVTSYQVGASLKSVSVLESAVDNFRKLALLSYGNVKFAFKTVRMDPKDLDWLVEQSEERDIDSFLKRNKPIQEIERIVPEDTYLLGYIVAGEIKRRLEANPTDRVALALQARRKTILDVGKRNHSAYLVSDHLDVYVATSMRLPHEYFLVSEFCRRLFETPTLSKLNLRYFDPTQAYCHDRIDKGLAEALMLKRAKCTIYLVQESDTLGKDSELASTLAQGKPVIAFVPTADDKFVDELISRTVSEGTLSDRMLELLRIFSAGSAWTQEKVRRWLSDPNVAIAEEPEIRTYLRSAIAAHYDKRATTIRDEHPLGIQVNLRTGVANGVLVVRSEADCAELVRRIVTSTLEFDVQDVVVEELPYVFLRERISGCIFRVMTGDQQLSNSFWNFYLS